MVYTFTQSNHIHAHTHTHAQVHYKLYRPIKLYTYIYVHTCIIVYMYLHTKNNMYNCRPTSIIGLCDYRQIHLLVHLWVTSLLLIHGEPHVNMNHLCQKMRIHFTQLVSKLLSVAKHIMSVTSACCASANDSS